MYSYPISSEKTSNFSQRNPLVLTTSEVPNLFSPVKGLHFELCRWGFSLMWLNESLIQSSGEDPECRVRHSSLFQDQPYHLQWCDCGRASLFWGLAPSSFNFLISGRGNGTHFTGLWGLDGIRYVKCSPQCLQYSINKKWAFLWLLSLLGSYDIL